MLLSLSRAGAASGVPARLGRPGVYSRLTSTAIDPAAAIHPAGIDPAAIDPAAIDLMVTVADGWPVDPADGTIVRGTASRAMLSEASPAALAYEAIGPIQPTIRRSWR